MSETPPDILESKKTSTVVLVGNPNVGKSVVFGYLTGKYVTVSNYPGTTVSLSHGKMRLNDEVLLVTDTPGTNSLIPQSEDERVTRDLLLSGDYDTVLQIGDSKNLKRSLYVTIQLAEMGVKCVLDLNMADEAQSRGVVIDHGNLEKILGIPVISTTAVQQKGLAKVKNCISASRIPQNGIKYPDYILKGISNLEKLLPDLPISKQSLALMLLSSDTTLTDWLTDTFPNGTIDKINAIINTTQKSSKTPLQTVVTETRLQYVDTILEKVYRTNQEVRKPLSTDFGNWIMHPIWGIGVVIAVLYVMFWFVGLFGAGTVVDFFESGLFGQYINPAAIQVFDFLLPFQHTHTIGVLSWNFTIPISSANEISTGIEMTRQVVTPVYAIGDIGVFSLFESIMRLVHDFFVGEYGVITMALSYGFAIVLPIVGTFFLLFSILEDSGYLPRLAVMLNKVFKFIGLNGKAILPMVLGLGCDTMATMTTRIMETRKERIIVTILLALGVPCSAQLGVLLAMMSSVSFGATVLWAGIVVCVLILVGFLASKVLPGESSAFILELPPLRKPQSINILIKTVARMEWYFKEVIPLFILGTVLLFILDKTHALEVIRSFCEPFIVNFLGLPVETTEAFLIGFLRRDYGAVYLLDATNSGLLNANQILIAMVTITLFIPCIANVFIIIKELNMKVAISIVAFIFPFAFLVGGIINFILTYFNIRL